MVRVKLPVHLKTLSQVSAEVELKIERKVTQRSILDALEARYPMLKGTIRDHNTGERRPYLRFFACKVDISHESVDKPLPEVIATGKEPFLIIGAISGG